MRKEKIEELDLHDRSVGPHSRKHGTRLLSFNKDATSIWQPGSNKYNSHSEKTHGPSRLDNARKFSVRAEISESFKNVAYSKYQPVPQFYFFDRLYGMFCQFVIGLIHRSCTVDQITAFSSFQYKYTFTSFTVFFSPSRLMEDISIMILNTVSY